MKGTEFKKIREQLDLTQEELAEVLCLSSKTAISNIETGFRNPSLLTTVLMRLLSDLPLKRSKELQNLLSSFHRKETDHKGRKS